LKIFSSIHPLISDTTSTIPSRKPLIAFLPSSRSLSGNPDNVSLMLSQISTVLVLTLSQVSLIVAFIDSKVSDVQPIRLSHFSLINDVMASHISSVFVFMASHFSDIHSPNWA